MTHLIELAAFLASISALFASSEILRRRASEESGELRTELRREETTYESGVAGLRGTFSLTIASIALIRIAAPIRRYGRSSESANRPLMPAARSHERRTSDAATRRWRTRDRDSW